MLMDAKRLWIAGGYGLHNPFDRSLKYVYKYGLEHNIPSEMIDFTVTEFFLELKDEPEKYRFKDNICPCGCGISKSGTAAVHELLKRLDETEQTVLEDWATMISNSINMKIMQYVEKENQDYIDMYGPKEKKSDFLNWSKSPVLRWFGYGE